MNNNKNIKFLKDKCIDWRAKIGILQDQISEIEKAKKIPIFGVSVFLLKTQLIEFKLKQLITSLDLYFRELTRPVILRRKIRTPKEFDDRKFTFGRLSEELKQFESSFLYNLQNDISRLVNLRNKFVHNLFSPGGINSLKKEAGRGIKLANKILREFEEVCEVLDKK